MSAESGAVRAALERHPDLTHFWRIERCEVCDGGGYCHYEAIAATEQECLALVARVCRDQNRLCEERLAEFAALPREEQPEDPVLPDGCLARLCVLLPDRRSWVYVRRESWYNDGRRKRSPEPSVFDVAADLLKVQRGECKWFESDIGRLE